MDCLSPPSKRLKLEDEKVAIRFCTYPQLTMPSIFLKFGYGKVKLASYPCLFHAYEIICICV